MLATSPGVKPTSWPCGTAPASARRTTGSPPSWPICAPRFGGPPTTATSTWPPPSRRTRGSSAIWVENYEPIAWAEELIEPAKRRRPPPARGPVCDGVAVLDRRDGSRRLSATATPARWRSRSGRGEVPFGLEGLAGGAYLAIGQPERWVEWCRAQLARGRDTHAFTRACLVMALVFAGSPDEAMAAAKGLIDAAEATRNPHALSYALFAYGIAFRDADPVRALDALRRGLVIAQDSGNRINESHLAPILPDSRPNTATRGRARSPLSGNPQLPRLRQHRHDAHPAGRPRRSFSTGSDATNRRPPSPVSRPVP